MSDELTEAQLKELAISEEEEAGLASKYKAPAEKSIAELQNLDADDEALKRYKESLLGNADGASTGDARRVVVKRIELHSEELKKPLEMDLTLSPEELKKQSFKGRINNFWPTKLSPFCFISHDSLKLNVAACGAKFLQHSSGSLRSRTFPTSEIFFELTMGCVNGGTKIFG